MRAKIVIPSEATHIALDFFEKPPLLVTFDQAFEQKTGPLYSSTGSSLEFEIVGDRNNFIDLQKIYLEVMCCIVQSIGNNLRYTTGDANASDTPFFVNNILHSLFAGCTVSANCNKILSANGHYGHNCFIETEFSHGSDAKKYMVEMSRVQKRIRSQHNSKRYYCPTRTTCSKIHPTYTIR